MRGAGSFLSVLLVAALLSGASGPVGQVARMLGSAAMFSEAAADNAVAVLNATGRMAASVSELAVSALGNSMALGETAWHGVDIYSVSAKKCVVHLTADSEIVLIEWLKSNEASILVPCISNDVVSAVQAAANAVTHGLPEAETTTENLHMLGNYSEVHLQAVLNDVGQVQVRFTIVGVNFRILWSNPIWETFEFAKDAERMQVLRQLEVIKDLIPSRKLNWTSEEIAPQLSWHRYLCSKVTRAYRVWMRWIFMILSFLGLDSLRGVGAVVLLGNFLYSMYWQARLRISLSVSHWRNRIFNEVLPSCSLSWCRARCQREIPSGGEEVQFTLFPENLVADATESAERPVASASTEGGGLNLTS